METYVLLSPLCWEPIWPKLLQAVSTLPQSLWVHMFVILWGLENTYFLVTFTTLVYEILLPPLLQSSLRPEGRLCRHIPFETSVWIPEPATGQQASLLWPCCSTTIPSCIREPQRHISHLHWLMEERSSVFPAGQPCFQGPGSGVLPVPCHPSFSNKSAGKFPVARLLYQHPQLYQRTPEAQTLPEPIEGRTPTVSHQTRLLWPGYSTTKLRRIRGYLDAQAQPAWNRGRINACTNNYPKPRKIEGNIVIHSTRQRAIWQDQTQWFYTSKI